MVSKFSRPKTDSAAIKRVIDAADTDDNPKGNPAVGDVRFTMVLDGETAQRVDLARRRGRLTRRAWLRLAIEKALEENG